MFSPQRKKFTVSVKLWSEWLQGHDFKDFTVSQFHSFTKRHGGWGKDRDQGNKGTRNQGTEGKRDQGSKGKREQGSKGARKTGAEGVASG